MGRRGPKAKGVAKPKWSADLAYAIGLLVTDGCLSNDGRHIILVSKDIEQLRNFMEVFSIHVAIGSTKSGNSGKATTRIQFGDVLLYKFLLGIGLMPNKSKIIGSVKIPGKYFFDFLRGHFDGDGSSYSYFDPRWKNSFMFYLTFASASKKHILWLQKEVFNRIAISGHITKDGNGITHQLKYAKADSRKLIRKMYYAKNVLCLSRKRLKINRMLHIIGEKF